LRHERGVSQEKLGELAGVHRTYVGALERGEQNVSLTNLHELALALGVEVAEFFPH
jgi:transcriptional regulator with XRE-family HTH domain